MSDFDCLCAEGFEGPTCAVNHDDCNPNLCRHGGNCTVSEILIASLGLAKAPWMTCDHQASLQLGTYIM